EQSPHELLLEEEVRIAEAVRRHDRAGGVHHHHADRQQHDHGAEQPHVRRQLAGHLIELGGSERRSSPRPPHFSCTHQLIPFTSARKTSPRCSKLSNMSTEAQAGDSRTTSPALAAARASASASASEDAARTGMSAAASAAPIFGPS